MPFQEFPMVKQIFLLQNMKTTFFTINYLIYIHIFDVHTY